MPGSLDSLPTRIFLDSNVLQIVFDYGGAVFENECIAEFDRLHQITEGPQSVEALRLLFLAAERGPFEFIVSEGSLKEAADRRDSRYLRWVLDVSDHTEVCLAEGGAATADTWALAETLGERQFGYLSEKDRRIVADAVLLNCDALLTMDLKLARNADHLQRQVGLSVLTPLELEVLLRPWIRLFI
jgi:hypothetical protein